VSPILRFASTVAALVLTSVPASAQSILPPTKGGALLRWLADGSYRATYTPEPAVRFSTAPHGGNVRAWLSPILVEDLRAGRPTFRKGAAMVKEIYFTGQTEVLGWSVMRKMRNNSGRRGQGWYFYETFDGRTPVVRPGRGVPICVSCHRDGQDFYLLGFQP